jgi:dihydroorotate dehydrogenase electron transfer subunit
LNRYVKAEISGNLSVGKNYRLLSLKCPDTGRKPKAGQFYMVQVRDGSDPLLKRPFSLFRKTAEGLQLLYRVQGKGTTLLGGLTAGDSVNLLGPLGNGYPGQGTAAAPTATPVAAPVIIAGGIGIASVFPLIEAMAGRATVLYGARTGDDLLLLDELKALSGEFHFCTDDGSSGEKGNVLDLLKRIVPPDAGSLPVIYACGPKPMLRAVSGFAVSRGIKAYLSLEEHMACGIGACLGCVVKIKAKSAEGRGPEEEKQDQGAAKDGTYQRVCMEGPVFNAEDIIW